MNTNSNSYTPENLLSSAYKETASIPSSLGNLYSGSTLETPSSPASWYSNISWLWIVVVILLLALIGVNIFVYLAKGTDSLKDFLSPTLKNIFGTSSYVTGEITKDLGSVTAGVANTGGEVVKQITDTSGGALQNVGKKVSSPSSNIYDSASHSSSHQGDAEYYESPQCKKGCPTDPMSDDSESAIQASKTSIKGGWCYIGEDNGDRSCISVNANDTCMSGDIFPTRDVCINPNLRK